MLKTYRDRDTGETVKAEQFDGSAEMISSYNIQTEYRFRAKFDYIVYCWQRHCIQTGDWIVTDRTGKVIDTLSDHELNVYYESIDN